MGIELKDLVKGSRTIEPFGPDKLHVTYTPTKITTRLLNLATKANDLGAQISFLTAIVTDWDLVIDSVPVPITDEALQDLPLELLAPISSAIAESINVDPTKSSN